MALDSDSSDTTIEASDTALQIAPPTSSDRHTSGFAEMKRVGLPVLKQVNDTINRYLQVAEAASAEKPNPRMSEYAGPQALNTLLVVALGRLSESVAGRRTNMSYAHGHDKLSVQVEEDLKKLLDAEGVSFVTSGTAANLILISSFVGSAEDPEAVQFVAREAEHSIVNEGNMLRKAGVRKENTVLLPERETPDGTIDPETLSQALEGIDGQFIFQMAIPSNEGRVPSLEELKVLVDIVKAKGGSFLVDGARIMNALVHWGIGLDEVKDLGIDGISLGTSKKGGLAELVTIFDKQAATLLADETKSFGHASSKNASLALVTGVMLTTDLWKAEAESENQSAQIFVEAAYGMGLEPYYEVNANLVFMRIPLPVVASLVAHPSFGEVYSDYGTEGDVTRLVFTGFESPESLASMIDALREAMRQHNNGTLGVSDESQKVTGYQSGHTEELPASQSDDDAKLADISATLQVLAAGQTST
jgi:threonine aldolase